MGACYEHPPVGAVLAAQVCLVALPGSGEDGAVAREETVTFGRSSRWQESARARWLTGAIALACGIAIGAGITLWRQDAPDPPLPATPRPSVHLVITGLAERPVSIDGSTSGLWLDALLIHVEGHGPATVTSIGRPGGALDIRVPDLPTSLSDGGAVERVQLRLTARDCRLATMWTPSARPFTLTWHGADGTQHTRPSGEHSPAMALAWMRHMDAVCARAGDE